MAPALRGCNSGYQLSVLSVPLGIDVRAMVGRTHAASGQREELATGSLRTGE
jgi:hypothetical protein